MKKIVYLLTPLMALSLLASCGGGDNPGPDPESYKVSSNTDGLIISKTEAIKGQEFKTELSISSSITGNMYLPVTLAKLTSGEKYLEHRDYTYTRKEGNKKAELIIPAANVVGDIDIELSFSLIEDPTLSMTYRYTEGENTVKFLVSAYDGKVITVYWGEGEVEKKTVEAEGDDPGGSVYFEHTYTDSRDYQIDIAGEVAGLSLTDYASGYYEPGNQHIVSVNLYKNYSTYYEVPLFMFGGYIETITDRIIFSDIESIFISEEFKAVSSFAFVYCKHIKHIALPSGLKAIGYGSFAFSKIDNTVIPYTVQTIGTEAFYGSEYEGSRYALQSVTIENTKEHPSRLETIMTGAFYSSEISSFVVPKSVEEISYSVFEGCTSLQTFTFEEGSALKTLGSEYPIEEDDKVFANCTALKEIHLPGSLLANDAIVGKKIFTGWTKDQNIYVPFEKGNKPAGWDDEWNGGNAKIHYVQ